MFLLPLLLYLFSTSAPSSGHTLDEAVWKCEITDTGSVNSWIKIPNGLIDQYDSNQDGRLEESELSPEIASVVDKLIWVERGGKRGKLVLSAVERGVAQYTHTIVGLDWTFPGVKKGPFTFRYGYFIDSRENPKCIASFAFPDKHKESFVFTKERPKYEANASSRGFSGFFSIGVEHIAFGFDHLLFVLVLILAGGTTLEVSKMLTAFTVAHSVTLTLAVLDIFTLPETIVEPVIAFSIVVAALENLRNEEAGNRWILAAAFGLIHGMSFASVLGDMQVSGNDAISPLLGFNLGLETGQFGAVLLIMPLLLHMNGQTWKRKFYVSASILSGLVALYWTFERVFGS